MSSQPEAGDSAYNLGNDRELVINKYKFKAIRAQVAPPGVPPYDLNLCSDYAISREETRDFTGIPESDLEYVQPPVEYAIEYRKLRDNDIRLAEMRKTFAQTRLDLNRQWDHLHHDEVELRKGFLRFNQFVKENLEKRERAAKKTGDEMILKQKRTVEVEEVKEKMKVAMQCRKNLEKVLKIFSIYEGYLNDVVKNTSGQFKTIDDVINRFETLNAARMKLVAKQEANMAALESALITMASLENKHRLATLGLNNAIAILEERFKNVNRSALIEERVVEKIKFAAIQAATQEHIVKATIRNVCRQMCHRKGMLEVPLSRDDYEGMLVFIKNSLEEIHRAQRMMKAATSKYKM